MLVVDVSQLLDHLGDIQEIDVPYDLKIEETDYKLVGPVQLKLVLISTGASIVVTGDIAGELEFLCSRCLNPYREQFKFDIEEEYKRAQDIVSVTEEDKELGEDDFVFTIDSEGRIDLNELVRQNIVVNVPLHFVCKEDCAGLKQNKLPESAINKVKTIDPRLAKLKDFKTKGSN